MKGYLEVSEPDLEAPRQECPTCGFDAVLEFPVVMLSTGGVTRWPPVRACTRCFAEAHP